jgi:hypothetical protein
MSKINQDLRIRAVVFIVVLLENGHPCKCSRAHARAFQTAFLPPDEKPVSSTTLFSLRLRPLHLPFPSPSPPCAVHTCNTQHSKAAVQEKKGVYHNGEDLSGKMLRMLLARLLFFLLISVNTLALTSGLTCLRGKGASLPALLLRQSFLAYNYVSPNVSISYQEEGSAQGKDDLISGLVDFAATDSLLADKDIQENPDLVAYPSVIAGVVVVYNLPNTDSLALDSLTVADIFMGKITWLISVTPPPPKLPS